ncbi:MAG: CYTH domain-containing protein [Proteobacteria bacterium]|nr:MAG: CYTH domain-containing protein [Pseudomonadota bacterium]
MAMEIERKFLVVGDGWRVGAKGVSYRQGYIRTENKTTVRVRIAGERGFLTLKGKSNASGLSREEFEYEIPKADAKAMLASMCGPEQVEKTRYRVKVGGHTWEVDEFHGENEGLIVAEIELQAEEETFEKPDWAGKEVSDDRRYGNSNLGKTPFKTW